MTHQVGPRPSGVRLAHRTTNLSPYYLRLIRCALRETLSDYQRGLAECQRLGRWDEYWILRKLIVEWETVERPQLKRLLAEQTQARRSAA